MADVFISYSSRNRLVADALKHNLESSGIRCWKAPDSILPGEVWEEAIISAIKNCRIVLLVWSTLSQGSEQVQRELSVAVKSGKAIIPYRIEDVQPEGLFEYYLTNTHWLDAYSKDIDCAIQEVVKRIEASLEALADRKETAHPALPEHESNLDSREGCISKPENSKENADSEKTIEDAITNRGALTRFFRRAARSGKRIPMLSEVSRPSLLSRLKTVSLPSRSTGTNAAGVTSMAIIELHDRKERPIPGNTNKSLLLVDLAMPTKLGIPASEITLFGGTTLEAVGGSKEKLKQIYNRKIDVVTPDDIFAEELYLLPGESALTNTWLLSRLEGQPLVNGSPVTPILPLRERARDLFSSRELEKACSLRVTSSGSGMELELTVQLRISGQREPYPLVRSFPIKEENLIDDDLPVVAVWPNVSDERWNKFYIFCEDNKTGLTVDGFSDYELKTAKEGQQSVKYFTSGRFPDLVKLIERGRYCGLIPVNTPAEAASTVTSWSVGIDFGTSFTNFFVNDGSGAGRRPLETRLLPLTLAQKEYQLYWLTRFFIPEEVLPKGDNPPTSTALNTYGWEAERAAVPEIFHQARIQWLSPNALAMRGHGVHTGFKWKESWYQEPFLKEIALMISCNAAAVGAKQINWSVSYPSAFSRNEAVAYRKQWESLCTWLSIVTGINHQLAEDCSLQTEVMAFARFFGNHLAQQMVHAACLDVGGCTTGISIWQDNTLIHQASIPFAGQDICTRVMQLKPSFIRFLFTAGSVGDIGNDGAKLRQDPNFNSWFDNCLRYDSDALLKDRIPILRAQQEKQLVELVSLMAISFAGIYHYLGLILRGLQNGGLLRKQAVMPVYMGGNGARFMNWLDESGRFSRGCDSDELMEAIQAMSAGFSEVSLGTATTMLSNAFKDEVACGLITKGGNLRAISNFDGSYTVGPVTEHENLVALPWDMACADELKCFIANYAKALKQLRITSLLPIAEMTNLDRIWPEIEIEIRRSRLEYMDKGLSESGLEPPFVTGLKSLTRILSREWAERH